MKKCVFHVASIFLAIMDNDNKGDELRLVSTELNLGLNERELEAVTAIRDATGHRKTTCAYQKMLVGRRATTECGRRTSITRGLT